MPTKKATRKQTARKNSGRTAKKSAGKAKKSAGKARKSAGKAKKSAGKAKKSAGKAKKSAGKAKKSAGKAKLLSGGNPQIPKGDGEGPVQDYIRAMPGWKRAAGEHLDAVIVRTVPGVRKAVRWNTPFYGVEGRGWFLAYHCFAKYIKVSFLSGAKLRPLPPVESKDENTRYLHITEDEPVDEKQLASWIRQAAKLPGWDGF